MEFPSVCYECVLLTLVTKEAVLANGLVELKSGRKSEQRYREKVGGVKEMPARPLPVNHSLVPIYRLIEMG